jgi:hypothetical protein
MYELRLFRPKSSKNYAMYRRIQGVVFQKFISKNTLLIYGIIDGIWYKKLYGPADGNFIIHLIVLMSKLRKRNYFDIRQLDCEVWE